MSNPLQTRAIAQAKVKTDKVNAHVLAQLLRCDFLPRVREPDEATQELRRLSRRAALVADRTGVKNRLHSVLAQRLLVPPDGTLFNPAGQRWLSQLELDAGCCWTAIYAFSPSKKEIIVLDQLLAGKVLLVLVKPCRRRGHKGKVEDLAPLLMCDSLPFLLPNCPGKRGIIRGLRERRGTP